MSEKCPIPKILLAVDGSDNSKRAVEHIACLVSTFKKTPKITLLHVLPISDKAKWVLEEEMHEELIDKLEEIRRSKFNKIFEEAEESLEKYGVKKDVISRKVRIGDPAKKIVEEAEEGKYTTIVMGKRGRSKIAEALVGSVTKTVVDRAKDYDIYIVK
jgi:nucleotide-binding universal stress UspA family protein